MVSVNEIYLKNKDCQELQAWISLFKYLVEGDDKKIKLWKEFQKDSPAKVILRKQIEFVNDINQDKFLEMNKPVLKKDLTIYKLKRSFAIAFCLKKDFVLVDFID